MCSSDLRLIKDIGKTYMDIEDVDYVSEKAVINPIDELIVKEKTVTEIEF